MEKQYDSRIAEKQAQELWQTYNIYKADRSKEPFSIDTPPPTVSGSLHLGHIFSYTQTDIIARYKRMNGHNVFYPFGFDDNGLPTERFIEKKYNVTAHSMSRSEFIKLCLDETEKVEKQFEMLWRSIGLSADWQAVYSTISKSTRKISQESFIILYKKGHIYRKYEPALYCTACRTSVSQAELDDKEVAGTFNDIVFKDQQGNDLLVGTTRPELLPSCVALLYNPTDSRYTYLKDQKVTVPYFNTQVPVIADELVSPEKGTGLVMCCTFGDKNDITWFKKYNLPFIQSIGLDGRWLDSTGPLAGLKAHQAREKMIELLKEQGLLKHQKQITHTVNVHERCKKEIEYLILPQWFIKILPHKQLFMDLVDNINWYPTFMKSRYQNWVENLNWDWGISRQRFFGIPFPAWHCKDCNEILLAPVEMLPIDPQETDYPGQRCPKCSSTNIMPDADVMDTWNTSSLTPYLCQALFQYSDDVFNKQSSFIPMSMRPQAHDIIRTWAFDTIIKAWMHDGKIPWKDIVISGHVLSDAKEKLSKSKDNAKLTPEHLIETYSADAIRYWTASGSLGHDVPFSENQIKIGQRLITKLWNAFRFIHEHCADIQPATIKNPGDVNEWLLDKSTATFNSYENYFEQNEFGLALDQIEAFFWHDFCDNYLELIKDQLFNPQLYPAGRVDATKQTLYQVGLKILQWYAPYLPHITETIYQSMYKNHGKISLHQTQFDTIQHAYSFPASIPAMNSIIQLTNTIRKLKTEKQLSLKTDIAQLVVHCPDEIKKLLAAHEPLIKGVTRAQLIEYNSKPLDHSSLAQHNNNWVAQVHLA